MTPRQAFLSVFKGKPNIMTPNVIACERRGKYFVELSTGLGIEGQQIYGVTVITVAGLVRVPELNRLHQSLHEASRYMDSLA